MINELELPKTWTIVKLGEVCFTTSGGTPSRKISRYFEGKIPWVKSGELEHNIILNTEENISEEAIKNSSAKIFPKGTILIALYGATVGKLAFLGIDASTNQAVCGIYKSELIDSKFLYNYLFSQRNNLVSQSFGGAQPNISQAILKGLKIPLPPLKEQHRIVSKVEELFSSLDKGIESLKTAQQELKIYRQAVLKYAFEGKLTNKNVNGELPDGWKWVKLSDVTEKKSIKALPSEMPDAKFIGMDCIEPHTLKPTFTYKFSEFKSAGNYFEKDHILYGRMRPYLNKVYKSEFVGTCSGEFIVLSCKEDFKPDLLKYILHSKEFVRYSNNKTSGDRPRVTFEDISDYPIVKPPLEDQQIIVKEIESRLSVCDKIEESIKQSLAQAEALRQSILKKAFEGKLVPQDPNDEPASKLLERIKAEKEIKTSEKK